MGSRWSIMLLAGLLGSTTGCQLTAPETLKVPTTAANSSPGMSSQLELPPKKSAEVCLATAEALEKAAQKYEEQGNLEKAAQHEPEANHQYEKARQSELEAIALYEKARQHGANKQVARRLAALYDKQADYARAMEEYQKLLKHAPKDADLLNDVGYCYYNQGKWTEAEKYLRQALAVNDKLARAWVNLGMTLAQEQRTEQALEAFTKVVTPAQARCNLAFIWMTQGKLELAKAAYRQALAQEPNLSIARAALAKLEQPAGPRTAAAIPATQVANVTPLRETIEEQTPIVLP
jgi:tetratricopeptide (TPR) repeat protein